MTKIRTAVIGAGRMGITHLALLKSDPRVEISSVADSTGMVLDVLGRYLQCRTFKDFRELLAQDRPQALIVCTPPGSHYEIIRSAAESRIHVFAEKPFTTSSRLAHELAETFEQKGLVNQVGYVNRFNDVFVKVRELVAGGTIGDVIRYRSEMFSRTVVHDNDGHGWRAAHGTGGGATFEMAAHAIDLVNFFIGKPERVNGTVMNRVYSKNVEDIVSATLMHSGGCTGTLLVNWSDDSVRKPTNKIELIGRKGKIVADQHSVRIYLRDNDPGRNLHDGWNTLYITDVFRPVPFYVRGNEYTRQLYHFIDNIGLNSRGGHCTFREGAQTLEVIEAMFANARELERS